jgi:Tol biopolymer transport system component
VQRPALAPLSVIALSIAVAGCASTAPTGPPIAPTTASTAPSVFVTTPPVAPTVAATATPSSTPSTTWPAAIRTPQSGRILFTIERDGESHLAYIDPMGFHLVPTANDQTFANAIWAPDNTIIFDSERAGPRHIFRMGIDGTNVVQLTTGDTAQDSAAVSPDGTTIAFGDVNTGQNRDIGIHLASIDGSDVRPLTPGAGPGVDGEDDAAFSPDGKWIAFERVVNPNAAQSGLFIIRPDGTGLRRLTDDASGAGYPRWSPDGSHILFSNGASQLWVVDVKTRKTKRLSDPHDPGLSIDANWSPDGKQIVYRHFTPGDPASIQLLVVDADGTHPTTLWVAPVGFGPNRPDWVR